MLRKVLLVLLLSFALCGFGYAFDTGVHAGVSSNPDQIYGGLRMDLGTLFPGWHLVAIGDLGVGEDLTVLTLSGDLTYHFSLGGSLRMYTGFGIGYNWALGESTIGIGLQIPVGLELDDGYFIEARIGFENNPDFRLNIGMYL